MIRGINHVALNSGDIDRLAKFYRDILGFGDATEEFRWSGVPELDAVLGLKDSAARQLMLRAGNCYLELFEFEMPTPTDRPPLRACDRGYTHIAFDVDDVDLEFARLKGLGMEFLIDRPVELGDLRAIYGRDPDGNLVELIEAPSDHPYSLTQLGNTATGRVT